MAQEEYDKNLLEAALASAKILAEDSSDEADSQEDAVERTENLTDAVFKTLMGEAAHQEAEKEEEEEETDSKDEAYHTEEEDAESLAAVTPGQGEADKVEEAAHSDEEEDDEEKETLSEPGYMDSDAHEEEESEEDEDEEVAEEAPVMSLDDEEDGVEGSADVDDGVVSSVSKISKAITAAATTDAMEKINAAYGSMKEDIDALCAEDESLTEEFKTKAATIFEAAVTSKAREHVESITEEYKDSVEKQISALHEDLIEKIDSYMTYVAEEWIAKNEIAVTNSLRSEIAESFMANLKDTFTDHYIEMPEGKTDMFDEVSQQNSNLSDEIKEQKEVNVKLRKQLVKFSRKQVVQEASEGLAATQAAKLASLVEDISFESTTKFKKKVSAIKEAYFSQKKVEGKPESSLQESNSRTHVKTVIEDLEPQVEQKVDPKMAAYIKASTKLDKEAYGMNN